MSITPRYPIAHWDAIEKNFWEDNKGRKAAVIHIAQGGYKESIRYMQANGKSSHFIVALSGDVSQMVEIQNSAWANGLSFDQRRQAWICPHGKVVQPTWAAISRGVNPNLQTISIEHEGFSGHTAPPTQLAATVDLLVWLAAQYPELAPYIPGSTLIGHFHLDPLDKAGCPGPGFNLAELARQANARIFDNWRATWAARGVPLPDDQENWAIPQLYRQHATALGACIKGEQYLVPGLSIAVFEHGLIYYVQRSNTAYVCNGFDLTVS